MMNINLLSLEVHYTSNLFCSIHLVGCFAYLPSHAAEILVAICDLTCFS